MRIGSTISIYDAGGTVKLTVPITVASRRRWRLMEEDSITLSFNLADSTEHFAIGDYIVDEIFGRFTISEEPLPADYDPVSGAYKYELRFDADWVYWKNYILMLTYNGVRRETSWVLTDTLDNHLNVVLQNLQAIGYNGYSKHVDTETVADPGKAVCITFSGTSILDALKALAEAYKCEFWLADETDGNDNPTRVIHFGKCETGEAIPLSMSDDVDENDVPRVINVENMVPTRNDSEYGNRFYVYGSTKNLPETYRKHLAFKADTFSRIGGYDAFKDSMRAIYPDMLNRSVVQSQTVTTETYTGGWQQYGYEEDTYEDGSHQEYTYTSVVYTSQRIPVIEGWTVAATFDAGYAFAHFKYEFLDQGGNVLSSGEVSNDGQTVTYTVASGVESVTIRYSYEYKTYSSGGAPFTPPDAPDVEVTKNTEYAYFASVTYSGGSFLVRLEDGFLRVVSSRESTVTYTNPPSGFTTGTEFTFATTGGDAIKIGKVPVSYYTDDDDTTDSVRVSGERRLMLPRAPYPNLDPAIVPHIQNGYVQRDATLSRDEIVERVVFFDEIYPRCALRVTEVDEGEYANDTTYSDGSKKIANLPAYILQAERIVKNGSDVDFPFDPDTMMVVGKLTATFLTPDEAKNYSGNTSEQASLLMGMTFDVACNRADGVTTYQLAWNSDYGDKLPNEILKPKVGDAFVLAGWNPAMMSTLGLITDAENELAKTADTYAELLEESQFTFECHMMSDWVLSRCNLTHVPFITSEGEVFTDSLGNVYRVVGPYDTEGLFPMGQKVTVHHGALRVDKETRVIGIEYKLDIPFDTPIYTVGETDAYSRLREIEKSLNAQSQSSTASSNIDSSTMAGGGSSSSGNQTLHLSPGTMEGMSPVDYNGSEEKSFRVPSVLDHLVDSDKVPRIAQNAGGDKVLVDKDGNEVSGKQFFEEKVDPVDSTKKYISLKSGYTGLASVGWLAAKGVGNGSSGGVSNLRQLSDVYHSAAAVLRADGTTPAQPGDSLVYNSSHGWLASPVSGGSFDGGEIKHDLWLHTGENPYGSKLIFGDIGSQGQNYVYLHEDSDDHLTIYARAGISLLVNPDVAGATVNIPNISIPLGGLSDVSLGSTIADGQALVYRGGEWSNETIQGGSLPIASENTLGGIKVGSGLSINSQTGVLSVTGGGGSYSAGTGININNDVISLKTASTSQLGGVKVDGTTITINNGIISASSGPGGGLTSIGLSMPSQFTVSPSTLTANGTFSVSLKSSYTIPSAQDWTNVYNAAHTHGNLTVLDNITATKVNNWDEAYGWGDHAEAGYVTLHTAQHNIDGAKTFTTKTNFSGGLAVAQTAYIDLGPVRIMYQNNALRITKVNSSDTNKYGLWADGFLAAYGVGSGEAVRYVNCTQNAYDNLSTKDPSTIYTIGTAPSFSRIYLGSIKIYGN